MPFDAQALKADLGGKPIWLWGILGGVVVLGGYYWYSSNTKAKAAGQLTQVVGSPLDQSAQTYPTVSTDTSAGSTMTANAGNALGDQTLETNVTWVARGTAILINSGVNGVAASNALTKYVNGSPVTTTESNYITKVLSGIGYPPDGSLAAVKVIKDATPVAKTAPKDTAKAVSTVKPKVTQAVTKKVTTNTKSASGSKPATTNALAMFGLTGGKTLSSFPNTLLNSPTK